MIHYSCITFFKKIIIYKIFCKLHFPALVRHGFLAIFRKTEKLLEKEKQDALSVIVRPSYLSLYVGNGNRVFAQPNFDNYS